ncbi:MAG TPA: class I SAM-dependent methyltransferase [Pirellulales bacterium]|jgi:SAM-dependent methyltransferase
MQSEQFQLHAQIEERHWWFIGRRKILRELIHKVAPADAVAPETNGANRTDKRSIVVDIGCGTGANLAALADEYRCVGIDTSAEAIALARQRFPGVTFICGFAPQDVAHWLRQASVVVISDVLEHVKDDRDLLGGIIKACPAGAQIVITVPADMRLWSPHDEAFGHYRRYDREGLAAIWRGLPVRVRLLSHFNSRLYPIVRVVRTVNRWRGRTVGAANTDFNLPAGPINSVLETCMAGEQRRLVGAIDTNSRGYRRGVSLVAILEREAAAESKTLPLINVPPIAKNSVDLAASTIPQPAAL